MMMVAMIMIVMAMTMKKEYPLAIAMLNGYGML